MVVFYNTLLKVYCGYGLFFMSIFLRVSVVVFGVAVWSQPVQSHDWFAVKLWLSQTYQCVQQ